MCCLVSIWRLCVCACACVCVQSAKAEPYLSYGCMQTARWYIAHRVWVHTLSLPQSTPSLKREHTTLSSSVFKFRPNCLFVSGCFAQVRSKRSAWRDSYLPAIIMLGTFCRTTPQAYIADEKRNCLHPPIRLVNFRGLRPFCQQKLKRLTSVHINLKSSNSAISIMSQTQTHLHSDRPDMGTEVGVEVAIPELQQLCRDALSTLGYDDQQGSIITEVKCCIAPNWKVLFLLTTCQRYFAGAIVCSVAQQQQQHGQGDHRGPRQAHRRGPTRDTTAEQHFCCH